MSDSPDPPAPAAEVSDPPADDAENDESFAFAPVLLRYRRDGWLPDKQLEFIEALADCGCVEQAARAVGMSRNAAYALRRKPEAQAFRLAWDAAMDTAVARLGDAAMARAIHGVAVPVFHNGELVGERRHFDERLTMFLLRYRDPHRYGKWRDRVEWRQRQDGPAWILIYRITRMLRAAWTALEAALQGGKPPLPEPEPVEGFEDRTERGWR